MPGFGLLDEYVPDQVRSGSYPVMHGVVTLKGGRAYAKYEVLGEITGEGADEGKFVLSAAAAADGSQTPSAILSQAVDATDGDVKAVAWFTGEFDPANLVFGAGHTAASAASALRARTIHLREKMRAS